MAHSVTCTVCGVHYDAQRSTSRYCSTRCRTRASRAGTSRPRGGQVKASGPALTVVEGGISPAASSVTGGLFEATEKELRAAGRLDTWQGQAALEVARRMESSRVDTGSAYAALVREHRAAMETALKGARAVKSAVQQRRDELASRRAQKAQ